jgi:CopG family nickel-responsive transcriptional regulator
MPHVDRFSVSLDTELLAAFDGHIAERGYDNRSEAVRDLIRDLLVAHRLQRGDQPVSAILSVVCDHREGEVGKRLRACLAGRRDVVAGTLAIPIDEHRDLLAVGLKGPAGDVQSLANHVQAMRGVAHGRLAAVPTDDTSH